jgi:monosaccharide-transporting ATPase
LQSQNVLEMTGIHKSFPGVKALQNVRFTLRKGEIHSLMGENGAGKSTLIKVMTGLYEKDAGRITIDGKVIHFRSPQDAQNFGIGTVYQEISLCPNLTVAENTYIGRDNYTFVNWKEMNTRTAELLGLSGNTGETHAAALELFFGGSADDRDCTRHRYGLPNPRPGRTDIFP